MGTFPTPTPTPLIFPTPTPLHENNRLWAYWPLLYIFPKSYSIDTYAVTLTISLPQDVHVGYIQLHYQPSQTCCSFHKSST